ncbi:MAG: hypothetical protein M3Y80_05160 [Verrucomicrobiota bacterium]|nr:hypothetical protein [Verrucomicrobiota bacterium]
MRTNFLASFLLFAAIPAFAAAPSAPAKGKTASQSKPWTVKVPNGPTINSLPGFPVGHLRFNINPKLYKSLSISPVAAWVVAQTPRFPGGEPKIIRSDAGGVYDKLALTMAKQWTMFNYDTTESRTHHPVLNVHLLVYQIADGIMAVNFSHNDEAFYAGYQRSDVWIGVWKDGKWTTVGGTKHTRDLPSPVN